MTLGERLEELLEERELTQRQLAKDLHIVPSALNGYIKGHRQPDHETIIRMAEYFDVSTDYLLGVTSLKRASQEIQDVREGNLLGIYRSLQPENQDLLMEQAHFYQRYDAKQKEQKEQKEQKKKKQ